MLSRLIIAGAMSASLLSGCSQNPEPQNGEVDDFAARIGNGSEASAPLQTSPEATAAPKVQSETATPENGAAPAQNDINPICGSPKVAPFFGRKADNVTRDAVMAAVAPNSDVRFIDAGSDIIPVPSSSRLNIKVDAMGVIRSATCG